MASGMIQVVNGSKVQAKIRAQSLKGKVKADLQVGYAKSYAIYVHERLDVHHPVGRAKFLEIPARRLQKQMAWIIASSIKNKNGLEEGMWRAGNLLLEESRKLVPVDTGALKKSGYVRIR